jgi:hypothetical protein
MPRRSALQKRTRQSAIVSRTLLVILKELRQAYRPSERNVGRIFQELIVSMSIRLENERGRTPCSIMALTRSTGLPYANVHRAVEALHREHAVKKQGRGYVGDGSYLMARIDARHFRRIVGAIIGAADELRQVEKNA